MNGLNIRRLGTHLGSAASAVYYHVKSKDKLVVLAADHVFGEIPLPGTAFGWRETAASLARGAYAMVVRHYWLIPAMSTHLIYGPGKARFDEQSRRSTSRRGSPKPGPTRQPLPCSCS
ncbi:hypothetical protein [Streptosporangium sp. LJ11]|uniref:hypothetical protein n=1 Tax=Streptosporangium sp. LJ11 TaxID=3436927 RepID=UPI003F79EC99